MDLRSLILGPPLSKRSDDNNEELLNQINERIREIIVFIRRVYGDSEASRQAVLEIERILELNGDSYEELACKRALILYAIYKEQFFFEGSASTSLAKDLGTRVCPLLCPRFFKESCQAPHSFTAMAIVMTEMWAGEKLGNYGSP